MSLLDGLTQAEQEQHNAFRRRPHETFVMGSANSSNPPLIQDVSKTVLESFVHSLGEEYRKLHEQIERPTQSRNIVTLAPAMEDISTLQTEIRGLIRLLSGRDETNPTIPLYVLRQRILLLNISSDVYELISTLLSDNGVRESSAQHLALDSFALQNQKTVERWKVEQDASNPKPGFRSGGERVCAEALHDSARAIYDSGAVALEYVPSVATLEKQVEEECGPRFGGVVRILFTFLEGDERTTQCIVSNQLLAWKALGLSKSSSQHFFAHCMNYLGAMCDVQAIIGSRTELMDPFRLLLKDVFSDRRLQTREGVTNKSDCNLFSITSDALKERGPKKGHPWILNGVWVANSPFVMETLGSLLSFELPREAVGAVISGLNRYPGHQRIVVMQRLLQRWRSISKDNNAKKKTHRELYDDVQKFLAKHRYFYDESDASTPSFYGNDRPFVERDAPYNDYTDSADPLDDPDPNDGYSWETMGDGSADSYNLEKLFDDEDYDPEEDWPVEDSDFDDDEDDEDEDVLSDADKEELGISEKKNIALIARKSSMSMRMEFIEGLIDEESDRLQQDYIEMKGAEGFVRLDHVLLRLINPQKVVQNNLAQQDFLDLIRRIQRYHPERDKLHEEDAEAVTERKKQNLDILRASIEYIQEHHDAFLDEELSSGKSIRQIILDLARSFFPHKYKDIVRPIDRERVPVTPLYIGSDFDTARMGFSSEDPLNAGLIEDAEQLLHAHGTNSYQWAIQKANRVFHRHFRTGGNYQLYWHHTGTDAMQHYVAQCCGHIGKTGRIIITDQEYAGITGTLSHLPRDAFLPIKTRHPDRPYEGLSRGQNASRTWWEMFEEMKELLDIGGIDMIIISSTTRLGDTPCSVGKEHQNYSYIGKLVGHLRKYIRRKQQNDPNYKDVTIMVDPCQSVGRTSGETIHALGNPDLVLYSGSKILGVGPAACLAVSKQHLQRDTVSKAYRRYKPSTRSIPHMVAFAQALNRLDSTHNLWLPDSNLDGDRVPRKFMPELRGKTPVHSVQDYIVGRLRYLTDYFIKKAEAYGETFIEGCTTQEDLVDTKMAKMTHTELVRTYGMHVLHPCHRCPIDYRGIVTVSLPNLRGTDLLGHAEVTKDILATTCHKDGQAVRFSLNHLQSTKNIDNLFTWIESQHAEVWEDQIEPDGNPTAVFDIG